MFMTLLSSKEFVNSALGSPVVLIVKQHVLPVDFLDVVFICKSFATMTTML